MAKDEELVKELLAIYNQVDNFLRKQPGSDRNAEHSYLIQQVARSNRVIARHEPELRTMAQLRNVIVHNALVKHVSPLSIPHEAALDFYRSIYQAAIKPQLALSIAIPASKIYVAKSDTLLNKVLKDMNDNIFTHVPIIEDNKMIGIFSENTLLSYLADNVETIILKDMVLGDFKKYLPVDAHKGEKFVFLPRTAKISDVYDEFNKAIKNHQRIGMLFITETGKITEKPLGVITAWDLASPDFDLLQ